ncbi:MAG TPA: oxygen-independent coproporphyrinogen III oxidase [Thermoanaerobaculia bacterium]|jgi:oxygen-independent coproporphyrinogen-3 oxidase|nr:oxygen-independent coproporphyrinogen III oxidase [Thermoanaerobaculia bacterium]
MNDVSYELLHKYNVAGPRYTSYPPAPSWRDDFGPADYEKLIAESNAAPSPSPLSLYLHLPFCEKLCFFCGCTVVITGKNHRTEEGYLDLLLKEIAWLSERVDRSRPVVQLHYGGGTPTYFDPERLGRLADALHSSFTFGPDAELGVEIDPRVTTPAHLEVLRRGGFNRLSMGVQDFDPKVQETVNRIQPYEATRDLVQAARSLGFSSINMDLIFGLPFQTPESFRRTIDKILSIGPDRLAVYSYAHVPWMKKHQRVNEPKLPSEREKFEIFRTALARFTESGYEYIGMDHFARPDDELARARRDRSLWRNFQGYTTKAGTDLFGLGMSSIGGIADAYVQNERDLARYRAAMEKGGPATMRGFRLSADDRMRRIVIQNLLCHGVIVKNEVEEQFGISFDETFADALEKLEECREDGLVEISGREIRATQLGRIFLRNLAMPFDAYLAAASAKPMFSRTL